jgi:co-chaperonin GroES (HSP10)
MTKNRVLVEDFPKPETTKSGIFLQQDKEDVRTGEVVAINDPTYQIVPLDLIVYNHDTGVKIDLKGKKYLVMGIDHILAVAEGSRDVQVS